MDSEIGFILAYIILIIGVLYPPPEAVSAGFTIPVLFEPLLGNESQDFIKFHMRRIALTLLIYSCLPIGFLLGLSIFFNTEGEHSVSTISMIVLKHPMVFNIFFTTAAILPLLALFQIYLYGKDWSSHPIALVLSKFVNSNSTWTDVSNSINQEYLRFDKIIIKTSPICTIVVTENWIIKVAPLNVQIAHQSDANITVLGNETYLLNNSNEDASQYLTIEVKSNRTEAFRIRLNALSFQDFQDRIARSIQIPSDIKFHKNIVEKFTEVFKELVAGNATFEPTNGVEQCIGCMQTDSNVKLQKLCMDRNCTPCYCKPMWCLDCLATWFAHRQDQTRPETWLSSKAPCPTCRATFCQLDVSPINM